mgnify:FL=1
MKKKSLKLIVFSLLLFSCAKNSSNSQSNNESVSTLPSTSESVSIPSTSNNSASVVEPEIVYFDDEERVVRNAYYDIEGENKEILSNYVLGKKSLELQNGLSILMANTQTEIIAYKDLKTCLSTTDSDLMDDNSMVTLYTRDIIDGTWNESLWNREHVWCKNHSNGLYTAVQENNKGAGSDIHHVRPALMTINSTRSNVPYGLVDKSSATQIGDTGNYFGNNIFEPSDEIKGDIARILMYVYVRYSSSLNSTYDTIIDKRGDLRITDIVTTPSGLEEDAWNLLLSWNDLDPVNYLEMNRNEEGQKLQNNRNVFIDHQEFARMCFDSSYDGEGALIDFNNSYDETKLNYIGINKKSITLAKNTSQEIKTMCFPTLNHNLTFISSNESVATISDNIIYANKVGKTEITISGENVKNKIKVEVVEDLPQFLYNADSLSTGNTYKKDVSKEITYNDKTILVKANVASASNGITLGTADSKTSPSLAYANLNNYKSIGLAMDIKEEDLATTLKVAALIFEGELTNIKRVTFKYDSIKAYTNMYLMYSIDKGETYQVITIASNLLPTVSGKIFTYDMPNIPNAYYAFGFKSNSEYVQIKRPIITFYGF